MQRIPCNSPMVKGPQTGVLRRREFLILIILNRTLSDEGQDPVERKRLEITCSLSTGIPLLYDRTKFTYSSFDELNRTDLRTCAGE